MGLGVPAAACPAIERRGRHSTYHTRTVHITRARGPVVPSLVPSRRSSTGALTRRTGQPTSSSAPPQRASPGHCPGCRGALPWAAPPSTRRPRPRSRQRSLNEPSTVKSFPTSSPSNVAPSVSASSSAPCSSGERHCTYHDPMPWLPRVKHATHREPCLRTLCYVPRRFQGWGPSGLVVWALCSAGQLKNRPGGGVITYNIRCQTVLLIAHWCYEKHHHGPTPPTSPRAGPGSMAPLSLRAPGAPGRRVSAS